MSKYMISFFVVGCLLVLAFVVVTNLAPFGRQPKGSRLDRLRQSPHFKNGQFYNVENTPELTEGYNMLSVMKYFIFEKDPAVKPDRPIPSQKTDLLKLDPSENVLVWFGHSSYFMQVDGKKILVDPVFSGHASPFSFMVRAFDGSDVYTTDELPDIDYLFLTHDHYDHIDYETVTKLKPKIRQIITGLGVGESLEYWGFDSKIIYEKDWNETVELGDGFKTTFVTARHFSGRGFKRNTTLWGAYVVSTPKRKIFVGGDSGYGLHFKDIGEQHGPFDLVILENGQYNMRWRYIHLLPEETLQAAQDLKAKALFPVHNSKFILANHAWNEPLNDLTKFNEKYRIPLLTPIIGEKINLDLKNRTNQTWWR